MNPRNPRSWTDESSRVRVIEGRHPSNPSRTGYNLKVDGDWLGTFATLDGAANAAAAYVRFSDLHIENGRVVLTPYPDPWGPGGKFIESGLERVPCPRCGAADVEPVEVPRPMTPGDLLSIRCRACGKTTSLITATGEWDLSDQA
jgi:hypothetical protein